MKPWNPLAFSLAVVTAAALTYPVSGRGDDIRCTVSAGQKAPSFVARTVSGHTVHFPADYKGKVVLLDFWATWCGPCLAELPNVVATYNKFHAYGFDALSVSLDRPKQGPALLGFLKANKMTWPQIYDGHYWKAAVAVKYGVRAIPCPILVDGDTGKILAAGADAVGLRLPEKVEKALRSKGKKLPATAPYNPKAPNKVTIVINHQKISAWRTGQLKQAEKQAEKEHKPIAWIASDPKLLDGFGSISLPSSRGATLHAFYALRNRAVLVFEDAFTENHRVMPLVDKALHTPNPHYAVPSVVFLDPHAKRVLDVVTYQSNFVRRAEALAKALKDIQGKY